MFTFLPKEYKKEIIREYRGRLILAYGMLFSLVFVFAIVFSLPAYESLAGRTGAIKVAKDNAANIISSAENSVVKTELTSVKEKLFILDATANEKTIISVIEKLVSQSRVGVTITGMSLKRGGGPQSVVFSGVALTRDDLVSFSKRLGGEPSFSGVNLPVSSLTKSKDIPFTISLESKF